MFYRNLFYIQYLNLNMYNTFILYQYPVQKSSNLIQIWHINAEPDQGPLKDHKYPLEEVLIIRQSGYFNQYIY